MPNEALDTATRSADDAPAPETASTAGEPASDQRDEDGAERPLDITRLTSSLRGPLGAAAVATVGLLILALFYTLYFARVFFLPVVLALLFDRLLTPIVRALKKLRIPTALGAALVLFTLLGGLGVGLYYLAEPASEWISQAPDHLRSAEDKLRGIKESVEKVQEATKEVEEATQVEDAAGAQEVQVTAPSLSEALLNQTQGFLVGLMVTVFLLYFLLASGDLFLRKLISVLPEWRDKRKAVEITHRAEEDLSTYLLTVTAINVGLGVAVAVAMWLLGMPNPLLWGLMATSLNFIPYVGAIVGIVIVALVAVISFESVGRALVVPGVYFGLTALEGYLITPTILGRRFTMNPVAIFISLIFWGWIWGVPGALLAVPLLVAFKVFCDNIEILQPLGSFLGR